jgi:hypothetical protein
MATQIVLRDTFAIENSRFWKRSIKRVNVNAVGIKGTIDFFYLWI